MGKWQRQYNWKRRNLDIAEATRMWETITSCLICGETDRLHIDHNHETGELRGVLCHKCNRALGFFKDNPLLLRKAADYLERG